MTTENPRHTITEDAELRAALADAARRWPELRDQPGRLIRRLVSEGHRALRESAEARREAVAATSGMVKGVYGPTYVDDLRAEWPA